MRSMKSLKRDQTTLNDNFTFGIVKRKLVWINFSDKLIQHIDFDRIDTVSDEKKTEVKAQWVLADSLCFSVKQVLQFYSRTDYLTKGVYIDEINEVSTLRTKKMEEKHDGDLCLMQLMTGNSATVYNMQRESYYEVSLIHDINLFKSPILFTNTGFVCQTA